MRIAATCITWEEPRVGRVIESFLRQSHKDSELLILDDAGWYPDQPHGDRWRIVSIDKRFSCLGAKRNAAISLVSSECEAFAIWDADDVYLPHSLGACSNALESAIWCQPRQILEWNECGESWRRQLSYGVENSKCAYHGSWAYRRDAFEEIGGYQIFGEEDNPICDAMLERFGGSADTICRRFPDPFYAYSRGSERSISSIYGEVAKSVPDINEISKIAYRIKGEQRIPPVSLNIGWDKPYDMIQIPDKVHPRQW